MQAFHEFDVDRLDAGNKGGGIDVFCQDLDLFCEQHVHLGSDAALHRKRQTQRRLDWIQALWDDPARFDAVVKSGRYRRLCNLTKAISQCDERAWRRLKNEVLGVRAREFLCGAAA
jgi:hypothetical protein